MFAMDWITALITMVLTGCLYLYIFYRKPGLVLILSSVLIEISFSSEANWGSSAQAQVFVNALKGVQVCFSVRLIYGWLFVVDASVDSMFPFDVSDLDSSEVMLAQSDNGLNRYNHVESVYSENKIFKSKNQSVAFPSFRVLESKLALWARF